MDRPTDPELAAAIVASLHEGIIVRASADAPLWWNDRVLEMLELTPEQMMQGRVPDGWRILDGDGNELAREQQLDVLVMQDGRPRTGMRIGFARPDRPTRWFRVNAIPLRPGTHTGVVTSFMEETDRVAAEHEVALARDRFSALVEHSTDLITVLIPGTGRYDYTSPAWRRLLEWDPGEMTTDDLAERMHPDDLEPLITEVLTLTERPGSTTSVVFRVRHADGSWRYLDTTITNLMHNEAVRGLVFNSRDITVQVATADELTQLALHDGLTGLPNRRLVLDRLELAVHEQRRDHLWVAVLFLDLDDFKHVNDEHGHAAGDELLVIVGQRLSAAVRARDMVGRMGGDEFVIVAVLRDPGDVEPIARHVEEALAGPIHLGNGVVVRTAASVGMVTSAPDAPLTSDELLAKADSAMYDVKRQRRRLRSDS